MAEVSLQPMTNPQLSCTQPQSMGSSLGMAGQKQPPGQTAGVGGMFWIQEIDHFPLLTPGT